MHTTRVKSERLPRILLMQPLGPDFLVRRTMYRLARHTLRIVFVSGELVPMATLACVSSGFGQHLLT